MLYGVNGIMSGDVGDTKNKATKPKVNIINIYLILYVTKSQ